MFPTSCQGYDTPERLWVRTNPPLSSGVDILLILNLVCPPVSLKASRMRKTATWTVPSSIKKGSRKVPSMLLITDSTSERECLGRDSQAFP